MITAHLQEAPPPQGSPSGSAQCRPVQQGELDEQLCPEPGQVPDSQVPVVAPDGRLQ